MTFIVMRQEAVQLFNNDPRPIVSLLFVDRDGVAKKAATFEDERLAMRTAELLNRHGLVDVPLAECEPPA